VKGRYGAGNGMRKQLHELGYNCDQPGSATTLPGTNIRTCIWLRKKPITDQTDMRLYSCYSYLGPCALLYCSSDRPSASSLRTECHNKPEGF
jgi:hypothetical protein